jgi:hypothetical protein
MSTALMACSAGMGVAYILMIVANLSDAMALSESFRSPRPDWFFPLAALVATCFWLVARKKVSTPSGDRK